MTTNNLKTIRKQEDLSLAGLGQLCGISKSHVYELERGSEPRIGTAYAVAKALDVSVYDIWPDSTEVIEEIVTVRRVVKRNVSK